MAILFTLLLILLAALAYQGIVGPVLGADGTTPSSGRQSRTGGSVVSQEHGKYYEAASRGRLAAACDAAGVATVTSISTTSIASLYNPPASGYKLAVQRVCVGYYSGTLGAGALYHMANPIVAGTANPTAPTSGSLLTSYFTDIFNMSNGTPVGVVRTGSTVVAPVALKVLCSVNAILASTATGIFFVSDDVDGAIIVEPGGVYQIQSVCAAGSTPKITLSIEWEEIPVGY